MEATGALLASSGAESPSPVSMHSLIPFFEGSQTVRTHMNEISSLEFFANDVLLTGSTDGVIRLSFRGAKDKKPKILRELSTGEGTIHHVARVGDRNEIVAATQSGKAELWDLSKGTVKTSIGTGPYSLTKVCHLPSLDLFLATGSDGKGRLLDFKSNTIVSEMTGLSLNTSTIAKHPNDSMVVTSGAGCSILGYDLKTFTPLFSLKRKSQTTALTFSQLGDKLFLGNSGGIIEEIEFWRFLERKGSTENKTKSKFDDNAAEKKIAYQVDRVSASVIGLEKDLNVAVFNSENKEPV